MNRQVDAALSSMPLPLLDRSRLEAKLCHDMHAKSCALCNSTLLAKRLPQCRLWHIRASFRITGHTDSTKAILLEKPGVEQIDGARELAHRAGDRPRDQECVLTSASPKTLEQFDQFTHRSQAPGRNVRYRDPLHRTHHRRGLRDLLRQRTRCMRDVDPRAPRDPANPGMAASNLARRRLERRALSNLRESIPEYFLPVLRQIRVTHFSAVRLLYGFAPDSQSYSNRHASGFRCR